ncbi:MAG TPA: diguanylate cyclase [Chloroflexia bacterium]|nr:diguanylate cyclase [Chloroflexia bacterium]
MIGQQSTGGTRAGATRPFYDPSLSYQDNYDLGPFGPFAEQPPTGVVEALRLPESRWVEVAGLRLRRPVGIPSGPLLNAKYVAAAFRWGYDLAHYKTVRTTRWPAHPAPNVLLVDAPEPVPAGELGRSTFTARPFHQGEPLDLAHLSITNSFGMPAQPPGVWQADMEAAARSAGPGQAMIASVTGTPTPDNDPEAFVQDHVRAAAMCAETGAHAVEVNLSCPNLGGHGLMCHDPESSQRVCRAVKEAIGARPLFAKIGDFAPDERGEAMLRSLVAATSPYVQGYGAVNAVPVPVSTAAGEQALPGTGRSMAGVCGAALRATGLDVVSRLNVIRREQGLEYAIIGVGGMMSPEDYFAYREAGADAVQGATGPMWNHALAMEIARVMRHA